MGIVAKRAYPGDEEKIGSSFWYPEVVCDHCGAVIGVCLDGGWAVFAKGPEPERSKRSGDWKHPKAVPVHWVHERCWGDWLTARPASETEPDFIRRPIAEFLKELAGIASKIMALGRFWEAEYTKDRSGGVVTKPRLNLCGYPELPDERSEFDDDSPTREESESISPFAD